MYAIFSLSSCALLWKALPFATCKADSSPCTCSFSACRTHICCLSSATFWASASSWAALSLAVVVAATAVDEFLNTSDFNSAPSCLKVEMTAWRRLISVMAALVSSRSCASLSLAAESPSATPWPSRSFRASVCKLLTCSSATSARLRRTSSLLAVLADVAFSAETSSITLLSSASSSLLSSFAACNCLVPSSSFSCMDVMHFVFSARSSKAWELTA
mmetsp:Transcript_50362/g.113445  ORF Transcript_50362/g.113445 Transcript_50362/m.113445 type:complete len:217 (+) Transcript_50362:380-1030(+)